MINPSHLLFPSAYVLRSKVAEQLNPNNAVIEGTNHIRHTDFIFSCDILTKCLLMVLLKRPCSKQCDPDKNNSLIWVHTVCVYAEIVCGTADTLWKTFSDAFRFVADEWLINLVSLLRYFHYRQV